MSELEELMERFCPSGVEYHKLHQVAEYGKTRIEATNIDEKTYVGVDNLLPHKQGKIDSLLVPSDGRLIQFLKGDVLIGNIRPYLRKIWLAEYAGGTNGDVLVIHITKDSLDSKFLYYCLSSDQFFHYNVQFSKGAKMPRGDKSAIMEYEIPLPPPEIQREIVHILDNFTELTARKEQYEYYLNELLSLDGMGYERQRIADVADIKTGIKPEEVMEEYTKNLYPYINAGTTASGYAKTFNQERDAVTTPSRGQGGIGFVGYQDKAFWLGPLCYCIRSKNTQKIMNKFIYYSLCNQSCDILSKKKEGGTPALNASDLGTIIISVPKLNIQQQIVNVLDDFAASCSGLTIGLPAEIEARRQQYEYYRDKLLTFRRK